MNGILNVLGLLESRRLVQAGDRACGSTQEWLVMNPTGFARYSDISWPQGNMGGTAGKYLLSLTGYEVFL